MHCCKVEKNTVFNTHIGQFNLGEAIGKRFGCRFLSFDGKRHAYLLKPTPELWTLILPHRTQILYLADISFITLMLNIVPGSVVVESGTGSGSFTHSLARTVAPNGHVHTFEFHQQRHEIATREFTEHGIHPHLVTPLQADACLEGFGGEIRADAVFLDLPKPWEALAHAKAVMRRDSTSRICCFSPCVEQVQKTVASLDELGFREIRMFECLVKEGQVFRRPIKSLLNQSLPTNDVNSNSKRLREPEGPSTLVYSQSEEVRGHTSFLTFASLFPESA